MNFKKLSRSLVCLLLVACMLVAVSPVRANATGLVEAVTAVAVSNPLALLGTVIVGLGVVAVADHYDVFDTVVRDCEAWMRANTDFFTEDGVYVAERTYGQHKYYAISESFIQAVRDFLFGAGVVSETVAIAGSEISVSTCGSGGLLTLVDNSAENTLALMKGLGVGSKVLILGADTEYLYGYYFDGSGILQSGTFVNPLGVVNASLLGTHIFGSLDFVSSTQCRSQYWLYPFTDYDYPIFYDVSYAERYPGFLTLSCLAFNWDVEPHTTATSRVVFSHYFKSSSNTVFSEVSQNYALYSVPNPKVGEFTWDTTKYNTVTSSLNIGASNVVTSDKTLSEGYADWATGAITLPGSTTIPNQDEKDKYYPIDFPPDISDVFDMTQSEAQGGTKTETDSNTGANSDPVTGTNLKSWLQSLKDNLAQWFSRLTLHVSNIYDSIVNGFASLVSALADLPALIAGIFRTLASHFKSIFLLGTLLEVLGEFLQALFGWLPESMFMVLMLTFGVAIFYKFIGR